jgi:hypothetical protein
VQRLGKQRGGIGRFDDAAEIHHGNSIADVPHDGKIV